MSEKKLILQGIDEIKNEIHYEVDEEKDLGKGGMGHVYFGYRIDDKHGTRSEVAVKEVLGTLDNETVRRAHREASIRLRNDNLVEMYGLVKAKYIDDNGIPVSRLFIVSEYLYGVTLLDLMNGKVCDKSGKVIAKAQEFLNLYREKRERFAVNVMKNILSGIMALHDAGYIHRDIDPSNIMITDDGRIKLIDFGVAHKIVDLPGDKYTPTSCGTVVGKVAYASPEVVLGDIDNQSESSDIYTLGILFFQLLTGKLPFEGTLRDLIQAQIHLPLPLDEIEDERLREIIQKATEKDQKDRYASAAEFRVALDRYRTLRPKPQQVPQQELNTGFASHEKIENHSQHQGEVVKNHRNDEPHAHNIVKGSSDKIGKERQRTVIVDKPTQSDNNYIWFYILVIVAGVAIGIAMAFFM